ARALLHRCVHFSFFFSSTRPPPTSTLFPYTTLFRSRAHLRRGGEAVPARDLRSRRRRPRPHGRRAPRPRPARPQGPPAPQPARRSEEHTSELQSRGHLVCRLLLEKKK